MSVLRGDVTAPSGTFGVSRPVRLSAQLRYFLLRNRLSPLKAHAKTIAQQGLFLRQPPPQSIDVLSDLSRLIWKDFVHGLALLCQNSKMSEHWQLQGLVRCFVDNRLGISVANVHFRHQKRGADQVTKSCHCCCLFHLCSHTAAIQECLRIQMECCCLST